MELLISVATSCDLRSVLCFLCAQGLGNTQLPYINSWLLCIAQCVGADNLSVNGCVNLNRGGKRCMTNHTLVDYLMCFLRLAVWRCTHAKLAPPTLYCLAWDRHVGSVSEQGGGKCFEAGNLSATISSRLTVVCRLCDYTLPFGSLAVMLVAARQLWSWPAWIIYCFFHCWEHNLHCSCCVRKQPNIDNHRSRMYACWKWFSWGLVRFITHYRTRTFRFD